MHRGTQSIRLGSRNFNNQFGKKQTHKQERQRGKKIVVQHVLDASAEPYWRWLM